MMNIIVNVVLAEDAARLASQQAGLIVLLVDKNFILPCMPQQHCHSNVMFMLPFMP